MIVWRLSGQTVSVAWRGAGLRGFGSRSTLRLDPPPLHSNCLPSETSRNTNSDEPLTQNRRPQYELRLGTVQGGIHLGTSG